MTDPADEPTEVQGPPPSAEPAVEQSLDAWAESTAEPTWTPIQVEGDASGAGPAGPAPDQIVTAAAGTPAGRSRRPSSLRSALDQRIPNVPRRPLSPPPPPRKRVSALRSSAHGSPADANPATPAPAGPPQPSLPQRFVALTEQRPEVGLGVAFLGGLLLATIIKRLGRR